MKLSTSLLFISWIPMIQLWLIRLDRERNLFCFIVLFVLSLIGGWCLIKSIPKNSGLYISVRQVFSIIVLAGIGGGMTVLFLSILYSSHSSGDLLTVLLLSFLLFIILLLGIWVLGKFTKVKPLPRAILIIISTLIFSIGYAFLENLAKVPPSSYVYLALDQLELFLLTFFLSSFVIVFLSWGYYQFLKKIKPLNLIINSFLIVFFSILLFVIPVLICIFKRERNRRFLSFDINPLQLIASIISVVLLFILLFLIWKETHKEDKPHLSILKFILASLFFLWQLNLGIHLYYRLPESMVTWGENRNPFFIDLESFTTLKLLVFIIYVILNLLFFAEIFFKGKFKERQPLLFSYTGFMLMTGMLAVLFGVINIIPLLTNSHRYSYSHTISHFGFDEWIVIPISFVTVIGPVLMIALVLVFIGGVLSFFKKGLRHTRFPGAARKKAMVICLVTVILYVVLFKTLWPFQDPAMDFLFGVAKNQAKKSMFGNASYRELLSYGKRTVMLLVNKLDDEEDSVRKLSAKFLQYLGDERAVEPLIYRLKDKNKDIQTLALNFLVFKKDPRAVDPLVQLLEKDEYNYAFIDALGELGDPQAIEPLLKRLDQEDKRLKKSVIGVLWKVYGAEEHMKGMKRMEKPYVLIRAINQALKGITGIEYPGIEENAAQWWREWWKKNREEFIKKGAATPAASRSARCRSLGASSQRFAEKTKFQKELVKNGIK